MDKTEKYSLLIKQISALIDGETDLVAVMANVCAAIHETMGFWWTGFYRVVDNELLLGPFQGPVARQGSLRYGMERATNHHRA